MTNLNLALGEFALIFVGSIAAYFALKVYSTPSLLLNLAKEWDFCLPQTDTEPTWTDCKKKSRLDVPHLASPNAEIKKFNWLLYRTTFEAPDRCFTESCSFFAKEIGDAAEIKLNDTTLHKHGAFPPNEKYAKHYPVTAEHPVETL